MENTNKPRVIAERIRHNGAYPGNDSGSGGVSSAATGEHGRRVGVRQLAQLFRTGNREEHVQRRNTPAVFAVGLHERRAKLFGMQRTRSSVGVTSAAQQSQTVAFAVAHTSRSVFAQGKRGHGPPV